MNFKSRVTGKHILIVIPYLVVAVGIILRIAVFLSNRSLILDEANVARNLFERDMLALAHPLSYNQFAPPLFLWTVKAATCLWGFSESGLRLFPFICSIVSLLLMLLILKKTVNASALWYPLLLLASGYIYIRYGTELKQYSSDVAIALGLIWLALNTDLIKTAQVKFFITWSVAGTLAIWFSMPAVFVLTGVFGFYLSQATVRNRSHFPLLISIAFIWMAQFCLYYFLILRNEIGSDYLQTWHKGYFITPIPHTVEDLLHNFNVLDDLLTATVGSTVLAIGFNLSLLITGCAVLIRRKFSLAILLLLPVICLLVAASLHKFTLLPRVSLFILPILLILIGIGLEQLWKIKSLFLRIPVLIMLAVCIFNFNAFQYIIKPFEIEEFKQGLELAQNEHVDAKHLHINSLLTPIYLYYTTIHPNKDQWKDLAGSTELTWNTNYGSDLHRKKHNAL